METLPAETQAGVMATAEVMYGKDPTARIEQHYRDLLNDAKERTDLVDTMTGQVVGKMTPGQYYDESKDWYVTANSECKRIADESGGKVSWTQVAGIIAATSPQQRWDTNVNAAQR